MIFKKMSNKAQGALPSWLVNVLIAAAFVVLGVAIAIIYKDQLLSLVDRLIGIRFGG